jgi:hypothetical protein
MPAPRPGPIAIASTERVPLMTNSVKILAVFNLIAAIGFSLLATMDLGMRKVWAFANYRFDLAIDGLPVDVNDTYDNGRPKYLDVDEGLAYELFNDPAMRTQQVALDKLQDELLGKIDDPNGNKVEKTLDLLAALAPNALERDEFLQLKQKDKRVNVDFTALIAKFNKHFDDARTLKDLPAKREAIAHILLSTYDVLPASGKKVDPGSDPAFQRLQYIIGARQMGKTLDAQTDKLTRINLELKAGRAGERSSFADKHQMLLNMLIDRHHKLMEAQDLLDARTHQKDVAKKRADEQEMLRNFIRDELEKERALTAEELRKLQAEVEKVYGTRIRHRDLNKTLQELEQFLRELEKKKLNEQKGTQP